MFLRMRLLSIGVLFPFLMTACIDESWFEWQVEEPQPNESSGHADVSIGYHDDMHHLHVETVPQEVLQQAYKGELLPSSLQQSTSCASLQEKLVTAWREKASDPVDPYCEFCTLSPHVVFDYTSAQNGLSALKVQGSDILFVANTSLFVIDVQNDAEMSVAGSLNFDFAPRAIKQLDADSLLVVGDGASPSSRYVLAIIDISSIENLREVRRFNIERGDLQLLDIADGVLSLRLFSQIQLPTALSGDEDFIELTENYRDSMELNELYRYAIENSDSTPPPELIEFQQGTQALVDAYEVMFDAKFSEHVGSVSDLVPGIQVQEGEQSSGLETLVCDQLLSDGEEQSMQLSQFISLDLLDPKIERSVALMGSYMALSEDESTLVVGAPKGHDVRGFGPMETELVVLEKAEDEFTLSTAARVQGYTDQHTMLVQEGVIYALVGQNVYDTAGYAEISMLNFLTLGITENGLEKLGEIPYLSSRHWAPIGINAVFMKDGLIAHDYDRQMQIFVDYSDAMNPVKNEQTIGAYVQGMTRVDENRALAVLETPGEIWSRELQLYEISDSVSVVSSLTLAPDEYIHLKSDVPAVSLGQQRIIGFASGGGMMEYMENNAVMESRTYMSYYRIDVAGNLFSLGRTEIVDQSSAVTDCKAMMDMYRPCDPYMLGMADPEFVGVLSLGGKNYAISHMRETIQLNDVDQLSSMTRLDVVN